MPSTVTEAFALRLKMTRISCGFESASDFSRAIGVEPHTYRKWERGHAEPSMAHLVKIQKLTGTSLDFLIAGLVPAHALCA